MKKQLLKKFYAFIVTAMMFSVSANAQIFYTDVIPDVSDTCTISSPSDPFCSKGDSVDINNDGIFDLELSLNALPVPGGRIGSVLVSPLHGSAIKTDSLGNPLSINLNDVIDANGSWMTTANQILIYRSTQLGPTGGNIGNWTTAMDGYLGLKIISGIQTNYSWVRLNVEVSFNGSVVLASFTIKDYAYNSIANQPILAGQTTTTGISPLSFGEGLGVRFFPNPANNHLTIALGSINQKVEVTIADITGKLIYKAIARDEQNVEVNTQDFAAGIFVVKIQTGNNIETKKLVIEK